MSFSRFLVGLIGIPLGILIIIYRVKIKDFMGNIGWAEKYLGQGGTWTALVFSGILISFFSYLWMFGLLQSSLVRYFGRFFGIV